MSNQWPKFDTPPKRKTVRGVLLEEGSGVSERTDEEVVFAVESESSSGGLIHHCYLVVPKVGYRYPLLRVIQDGLNGYPVKVFTDDSPKGVPAADEQELRRHLGNAFRSNAVAKVVPQLLELVS